MNRSNLVYRSISIMLICMIIVTSILSVIPKSIINDNTNVTRKSESVYYNKHNTKYSSIIINKTASIDSNADHYVGSIKEEETEEPTTEPETIITEEETTVIEQETTTEEPTTEAKVEKETTTKEPETSKQYNSEFTEDDIYHLAKIIMAEAEASSQLCKEYVGQVVVNRYRYGKYGNSIKDVVFANNGKTWQFSPCKPGGRWYRVEPNQACYDAAYAVINAETPITDAWYFEDCKNPDNWHSRTLVKVATVDGMRFYRR